MSESLLHEFANTIVLPLEIVRNAVPALVISLLYKAIQHLEETHFEPADVKDYMVHLSLMQGVSARLSTL